MGRLFQSLATASKRPQHFQNSGYFQNLFVGIRETSSREIEQKNVIDSAIKPICFYLPQFHPIPENNEWWGNGFTEWTNVTRAIPQFIGHYQPRLPLDLGFYDLRLKETHELQTRLAMESGIYGFCYYYYWFDGKRLLEHPLDLVLKNPDLKFPFCVCWANENWSRRWDGLAHELLMKQSYKNDYEADVISDMIKYLRDPRYIKVNDRPLIVVYRPSDLPSAKNLATVWRKICADHNLGNPFLLITHSFDNIDPTQIGFDGAIEFAPNNMSLDQLTDRLTFFNRDFSGHVLDYSSLLRLSREYIIPSYKKFRGICPSWDNEARKPGRGTVVHGSTPTLYEDWLNHICNFTVSNFEPEEQIIFINAWNEWAEGAYLEPDSRYGHAYLNATKRVLGQYPK